MKTAPFYINIRHFFIFFLSRLLAKHAATSAATQFIFVLKEDIVTSRQHTRTLMRAIARRHAVYHFSHTRGEESGHDRRTRHDEP